MMTGAGSSGMMSGLSQSMLDDMNGVLSGATSGSTTFTGVMQGMLNAMDDFLAGSSTTTATGATTLQTMVTAMEGVLSGTSAGTGNATSYMQSMLNAMESIVSGGSSSTAPSVTTSAGSTGSTLPQMMLSTNGHVLAATMSRADLTVTSATPQIDSSASAAATSASTTTSAYNVGTVGGSGQTVHMASGADTIVAADGEIMLGLNQSTAGTVWHMYQAALAREPDASGFQYWMSQVQNGMSVQDLAHDFMNSSEFQTKYGQLTNQQFVDQLYQSVLNRAPDSAGEAYWTDQLNHGVTRDTVLIGFANSTENANATAAHAGASGYWVL